MNDSSHNVAGWREFVDSLDTLPARMLEKLPAAKRDDPQIQQEVARLALESLAHSVLAAIGSDGEAPQFLPTLGQVLNVGQPNADTVYRSAHIAADGAYRLTGKRGSLALAMLSQVVPRSHAGPRKHLELAQVSVDENDCFDILVSAEKPPGYTREWWELDPAAVQIMIRMVSADWENEEDPTLSIERVDKPLGRPRPPADVLEKRLRALPTQVETMALMFSGHFERLRDEGYVNALKILTLEFGALDGQFYYEGIFDLAEDEALIIESPIPEKCDYRSLILVNEIYETIDWYNNHSSLNGAQSVPDPDGKLRIVVSARDPGVKNWLDTAGHPRGIIQGRWTGCDSQPIPVVHKVRLDQVLDNLPKGVATVTAEERQQIIRKRRAALQQRPLW